MTRTAVTKECVVRCPLSAVVLCLLALLLAGCAAQPAKTPASQPGGGAALETPTDEELLAQARELKADEERKKRRDLQEAEIALAEVDKAIADTDAEDVPPVTVVVDPSLLDQTGFESADADSEGAMRAIGGVISVGDDPRDILEIDPDKGLSIFFYHLKNLSGMRMRIREVGGSKPLFAESTPQDTTGIVNGLIAILTAMVNLNSQVGESITFYEHLSVLVVRASQEKIDRVRKYLAILDRERPQVRVLVQIAEVTEDDEFQFGVDVRIDKRSESRPIAYDSFQARMFPQNYVDFLISPNAAGWQGTTLQFSSDTGALVEPFQYVIRALEEMGNANLLSSPELLVAQGELATIRSGDDTPIVMVTTVGTQVNTAVQYRETGVKLYVTPIAVNPKGCVLNFVAEFSLVTGFTPAAVGAVVNPIISIRKAETTVFLTYDQMIRIGGLVVEEKRTAERSIPWINKIPILGKLLGTTRDQTARRDLYFYIKPNLYLGPEQEGVDELPFDPDDLKAQDIDPVEFLTE